MATMVCLPATANASVVVEGRSVASDIHAAGDLLAFKPIFDELKLQYSFNAETGTLRVQRPYDNAVLELLLPGGMIRANGRDIGTIATGARENPAEGWLTPNTISILSGTISRQTPEGWIFDLDERLRPDANLQLWINGKRVSPPQPPRASGSLLLVPLRPIADALGSRVTVEGNQVSVIRIQDGVTVTWNAGTGLIAANRKPVGIVNASALVDLSALMLPRDAVAALTGTNIQLVPGTNRVEATLDDRLADSSMPTGAALDRARATPFQVERSTFQIATAGTNYLTARAHMGLYNGTLRLEAPATGAWLGRLDNANQHVANPLRPNWISLDWQSMQGSSGILGDGVAGRRELDGVSVSRWRGAAYQTPLESGALRLVAGQTVSATANSTGGAYYPAFDGSAFGARWYGKDGIDELALAHRSDSLPGEGNQTVLTWTRQLRSPSLLIDGVQSYLYTDLNVGHMDRQLGGWGTRGMASLTNTFSNAWNVSGSAQYASGVFNGPLSRNIDGVAGTVKRAVDTLGLDASVGGPVGSSSSISGRIFGRRNGVADALESRSHGSGLGFGTQWAEARVSATLDYSTASGVTTTAGNQRTEVDRISLTLDKRWDAVTLSGRLEDTRSKGPIDLRQRSAITTISHAPWYWLGSHQQSFSIGPLATLAWSRAISMGSETTNINSNAAVNMSYQSGSLFGEKARVSLNAGWSGIRNSTSAERTATQLSDLLNGTLTLPRTDQTVSSTGWYFNLRTQHILSRSLMLEWGANKAQGTPAYAYLQLNGAFDFAAPRSKALPMSGRGVLEGQLYFDANGNGTMDPGERGIPGADVRLLNTPWALRSSGNGNFAINNLPQGPYAIAVDLASLPIGFRLADKDRLRVAILDGQVTEVKIPIIEVGQIRGRLFVDSNGNGVADSGEEGLLSQAVFLTGRNVSLEARTVVFGQYVFDLVPLGSYTLRAAGREYAVTLDTNNKFVVLDIPLPASDTAARP